MNTNGKQTKNQLIEEIIDDVKEILEKVENNTASVSNYQQLQEIIELLGGNSDILLSKLKLNGFSNWNDFVQMRNKPEEKQNTSAVYGLIGAIRGVSLAAVEYLNKLKEP